MLLPYLVFAPFGFDPFRVILLALAIDIAFGDPPWLYKQIPHPVALIGRAIAWLDDLLNRPRAADGLKLAAGASVALTLTALAAVIGAAVFHALVEREYGWIVEALIASAFIAYRGLYNHVRAVAAALDTSLEAGRAAVAQIVGRDTATMDETDVARAAVESAAENFSDGTVAPVFWYLVFGLPGLIAYKTINTLDSMIGHRTDRHAKFGRVAARLDDAANWIPARLAALILIAAAVVCRGAKPGAAWKAAFRDGRRHRSVNAGWPEAAMAGAFGWALGGPRLYHGQVVEDAWMGDGRADLDRDDIRHALRLFVAAGAVLSLLLAAGFALARVATW